MTNDIRVNMNFYMTMIMMIKMLFDGVNGNNNKNYNTFTYVNSIS